MVQKKTPTSPSSPPQGDRLQKILALSGLGSRRQSEELITSGRVEVDRKVVNELGARVDIETQEVRVDGEIIRLPRKKYFLLHKPVDVISTSHDPWARTRVLDLIGDTSRLFTVGRLDKASSGLILVTNDGDLAQKLTHPKYGIEKVYRATVVGKPSPEAMKQLRQGLYLAEGKTNVERVTLLKAHANKSLLEIVLKEGRNREIRRILARVGHKVVQLKRIAIGPLRLGELPLGAFRELTRSEVQSLQRASQAPSGESKIATKKIHSSTRPAKKKSSPGRTPRDPRRPAATGRRSRTPRTPRSNAPIHARRATVIGEENWPAEVETDHHGQYQESDESGSQGRSEGRRGDRRRTNSRREGGRGTERRDTEGRRSEGRRSDNQSSDRTHAAKGARRKTSGRPRSTGTGSGPSKGQGSGYGRESQRASGAPKKKGRRPVIQRKKRSS